MKSIRTGQGLIATRPVGSGKTQQNILTPLLYPNCSVALLVTHPALLDEVIHTYEQMMQWRVPHIIVHQTRGRRYSRIVGGTVPLLHVIPHTKLSRADADFWFEEVHPDLVIGDEGASLMKNRASARTARLLRYLNHNPRCQYVIWADSIEHMETV